MRIIIGLINNIINGWIVMIIMMIDDCNDNYVPILVIVLVMMMTVMNDADNGTGDSY